MTACFIEAPPSGVAESIASPPRAPVYECSREQVECRWTGGRHQAQQFKFRVFNVNFRAARHRWWQVRYPEASIPVRRPPSRPGAKASFVPGAKKNVPRPGVNAMAIELTVVLDDVPGALARLGKALGDARVNIGAIQGMSREGKGVVRFVPDDPERAAHALESAGITVTRRGVLVVRVLDEPGTLGDVALVMATAGINIDAVYVTTRGRLVLSVDDLDGAIHVAEGLAVMTLE